jgi:glycosyltransferase involved in cell wall biosynthesis
VDLLTYGEGEDVDVPGLRVIRIPRFGRLGAVRTGPSYLKLFLDQFLLLWTVGLLLRRRYDVVHAHEEAVFLCLLLKPFFRFKLIYDMHSSLPEQLHNFAFTESTLLTGAFRWLESRALARADAVITICPELAAYAASKGVPADRHFLIENTIIEPVRLRRSQTRAGEAIARVEDYLDALPAEAPLLIYAGTLEPYQGIDLLLAAFAVLHRRAPDARLLVLGGDVDQRRRYEDAAKSAGIQVHTCFPGRVPQDAAQRFCRRATLQISPRVSGTNTPLKLYEQLASGIPIVATRVPAHTQLLDDDVAFLADPEPGALADEIERAIRHPQLRSDKAASAARLYARSYSRERYVQKMSELLKGL